MDILNVGHGIVCHQVNLKGVMGRGLAGEIAAKWPTVYRRYRSIYQTAQLGQVQAVIVEHESIGRTLMICNLYAQDDYGTDKPYTQYGALGTCFNSVAVLQQAFNLPVFLPWKIGCGLAGGDWNIVKPLIRRMFRGTNTFICIKDGIDLPVGDL